MYKKILQLAGPIILANLLQMVYQMTDMFWIGRYSTEGIAAVSLAGPIIFFFMSLGIGLTIAGSILVSQNRGAKRYHVMNQIVGQSLTVTTIFSIVIAILGYMLSPYVIQWMGAEKLVTQYATSYLQISFLGIVAVFGYLNIQSLRRGMGEVKLPLYIVISTVLLNTIIDPILILGWGPIGSFGVDGAARATLITQLFAWIAGLWVLYRNEKYHVNFNLSYFRTHSNFFKKYIGLAIPSSIEMSARSLGMAVLAYIVATYGTIVTAAYGVGNQVVAVMIFLSLGFSMAATTLAGQYFGGNQSKKIIATKEASLKMSIIILLVLGVVVFILAPAIAAVFVPGENEVITVSSRFLRIIALFLWTYGIQMTITGMFRGFGETKVPMIITLIALWVLQIPIAYRGSKHFGPDAIRRSLPIANLITAAVAWWWYEYWKRKNILPLVKH